MRQIHELYKVSGTALSKMDMTTTTPMVVFVASSNRFQELAEQYYAVIDAPANTDTEMLFVNISALFTMTGVLAGQAIAQLTWEQLAPLITDQMIFGYSTEVPNFTNGKKSLTFAQPLHLPEYFELFYTRVNVPKDRNVKFRRWQLLDLGISKLNPMLQVDLSNSLVSVNGLLSLPTFFEGELLIPRGAEFMHNTTATNQPSVTILDFSGLGGITCVPFSACTKRVKTGQKADIQFDMGLDIEIFLPEKYSLKDKSVFMVLGHSLFFPESCKIISDRSIMISPHHYPVGNCLLKQKLAANKFNDSTDALSTDTEIQEYLAAGMYANDHTGAFFVIVDSPKLYIQKSNLKQHVYSQMHVGQPETQGFLWDQTSMSIVDQTKLDYRSYADFHAYRSPRMTPLSTYDYYAKNHAIEALHPHYASYFQQIDGNKMFAIQITRP